MPFSRRKCCGPSSKTLQAFVAGLDAIVETQTRVAKGYFEDGSIEGACPPLKALLHIMAHGHYEGMGLDHPRIRALFTREALLQSPWYHERLITKQARDVALWTRHGEALEHAAALAHQWPRDLSARRELVARELARVSSEHYLDELVGTIGADPFHGQHSARKARALALTALSPSTRGARSLSWQNFFARVHCCCCSSLQRSVACSVDSELWASRSEWLPSCSRACCVGWWIPGIQLPDFVAQLGLVLFVYTLGLASGPAFFASLRLRGVRDNLLASGVLSVCALAALGLARALGFGGAEAAGVFAGSLTNTPALAAALETLAARGVSGPALSAPVIACSICYPLGVLVPLVVAALCDRWFNVSYAQEQISREYGSQSEAAIVSVTAKVLRSPCAAAQRVEKDARVRRQLRSDSASGSDQRRARRYAIRDWGSGDPDWLAERRAFGSCGTRAGVGRASRTGSFGSRLSTHVRVEPSAHRTTPA